LNARSFIILAGVVSEVIEPHKLDLVQSVQCFWVEIVLSIASEHFLLSFVKRSLPNGEDQSGVIHLVSLAHCAGLVVLEDLIDLSLVASRDSVESSLHECRVIDKSVEASLLDVGEEGTHFVKQLESIAFRDLSGDDFLSPDICWLLAHLGDDLRDLESGNLFGI